MNIIKERRIPILIASIQWFTTTVMQVDRLFFTYDNETNWLLATKFLYLIFLLVAWCFAFTAIKKIRTGDENWKRGFWVFGVYLAVMMCFLLILWPGTWAWDDLATLNHISTYNGWDPWQHTITGAYQDVLLQILPFPGGIILLQNVIISVCVAFVVTKLELIFEIGRFKNKCLDIIIKISPFLLPPVIMYQFSGYRIGLYVHIELVMLVMLIGAWKDKTEWSLSHLILFCFLCVMTAVWRTESFFYIPCACLLVVFVKKHVIPNRKKIICITSLIIGFLGVTKFQNWALGNGNYEVISLLRPCVELVRVADYEEDAELLTGINRVADLEVIHNNPTMNGESLYWGTDIVKTGYTDEDYDAFLKATVKLSLKYPKVVILERLNMFIRGSGISGLAVTNVGNTAALFDENNGNKWANTTQEKGWFANTPVFKNIRKQFIYLLGMKKPDGSGNTILQRLVWNSLIPLTVLIYVWFKLLIKRRWYLFGICTAVLIRVPIVILTEPSSWMMYVMSFYFLGYVYLIYKILVFWSEYKKLKEQEANG